MREVTEDDRLDFGDDVDNWQRVIEEKEEADLETDVRRIYITMDLRSYYATYEKNKLKKKNESKPVAVYNIHQDYDEIKGAVIPKGLVVISATYDSLLDKGYYSLDHPVFETLWNRRDDETEYPEEHIQMSWEKYQEYRDRSTDMFESLLVFLNEHGQDKKQPRILGMWKYNMDDFTAVVKGNYKSATAFVSLIESFYKGKGFELTAGMSVNESYAKLALSKEKKKLIKKPKKEYSEDNRPEYVIDTSEFYDWDVRKFYNIGPIKEKILKDPNNEINTIGELLGVYEDPFFKLLGDTKITRRIWDELDDVPSDYPLKGDPDWIPEGSELNPYQEPEREQYIIEQPMLPNFQVSA